MSLSLANDPQTFRAMAADPAVADAANALVAATLRYKYSYNFTWLGRPVIQFPPDVLAVQEILWGVRPGLVVETGIAHGGSLVLSASILELIGGAGHVVGIDIDIREHNRRALEEHPLFHRMTLIEGSSVDAAVASQVRALAAGRGPVVVILDSMHTHDHVLRELELYSPLVTPGSYLVVFDTVIEDLPAAAFPDRPWGPGNSPKSAVRAFLAGNPAFVVDRDLEARLLISAAPEGYLRRLGD
jgi:cephalosporin hydroxylase